jgi:hypothetical protein
MLVTDALNARNFIAALAFGLGQFGFYTDYRNVIARRLS